LHETISDDLNYENWKNQPQSKFTYMKSFT